MVAGRRLGSQGTTVGSGPAAGAGGIATLRALPEVFQYTRHALQLVWSTSRPLTIALALLTLVAGVLPAGIAYVGALIVDAVVAAIATHSATGVADLSTVLGYVILEGALVAALAATQRGLATCQSLLRAQLGQRVNEMILEKALTLELRHFEDSEFSDKLTRARREASPTDGSGDTLDLDADGHNTWQEWRCQTVPTNALSALRLLSATRTGTKVIVSWQSVSGVNYFVERSTNLWASPPFTPLAANIPGQPGTTSYTNINAAPLPRCSIAWEWGHRNPERQDHEPTTSNRITENTDHDRHHRPAASHGDGNYDGVARFDMGAYEFNPYRFEPTLSLGTDGFRFTIRGEPGKHVGIERSRTPVTWEFAGQVPVPASGQTLIDPAATRETKLFYRAMRVP